MTQINASSVATDCGPPTSHVQRILITHLNLYEICDNGNSLGENASLEEISQEILFYHQGSPVGFAGGEDGEWNLTPAINNGRNLEEAASFLGLCKALYSVPTSLHTPDRSEKNVCFDSDDGIYNADDRTNFVHFGNSMLVFVPLESTLDVVAVVQVSRLYQNGTKSCSGGGNPHAISAAIKRTHRLFCLLRGGGIVHRLNETRFEKPTEKVASPYGGMKKMFRLLKQIREYRHVLYRQKVSLTLDQNIEETTQRITALEREVESYKELLPIQSLRRDLESHYNEYLNHFLEVCMRNGGAGRCLVEMMPVPIADNSGSHVFQLLPSKIKQQQLEPLKESMLEIFRCQSSCLKDEGGLKSSIIGIAMFENGGLVHYFPNSGRYYLSNNDVSLLMAYMASYKTKMGSTTMSIDRKASSPSPSLTGPQVGLLKRLAFHFGPMVDKMPNKTAMPANWKGTDSFNTSSQKHAHCQGRFLCTPPPFMFGSSEHLYSLAYDNNIQDIWAPRVHLPLAPEIKERSSQDVMYDDEFATHMVVFDFLGFSFLIFIYLPWRDVPCKSQLSKTVSLLIDLGKKLSNVIINSFHDQPCGSSCVESVSTDFSSEPGQDIIIVEKSKGRMCLIQSPQQNSKRISFRDKRKVKFRGFAAFSHLEEGNISQSTPSSHRCRTMEWSALGLDCRHWLSSRLPLDICLAFDDMINEIRDSKSVSSQSFSRKESNDDEVSTSILELCTCMPYGWIYALTTEEKEIFVLFDSSIYVTVADIQSAVLNIKEKLNVTK